MVETSPPNAPPAVPTPPKNFKTRAGIQRKTKEEREQYAREEALRNEKRLPTALDSGTDGKAKGQQGGKKARAGASQPDRIGSQVTGGVFGAAVPAAPKPRGRKGANVGAGAVEKAEIEVLGNGDGVSATASTQGPVIAEVGEAKTKKKVTTRKQSQKAKKGNAVDVASDESGYEEPRRDIETIWISSDDEMPISARKDKGKQVIHKPIRLGAGPRPVRAPRDAREIQDVAMSSRNRVVKGKERDGDTLGHGIVIGDEMDVDPKDDPLTSPELRPKTGKKRSGGRSKEVRAAETIEEKAERLRVEDDTTRLREELSHLPTTTSTTTSKEDDDMDADVDDDPRPTQRLYLFQFPPYTPYLDEQTPQIEIKDEVDIDLTVPSTSTTAANPVSPSPPNLKTEDPPDAKPALLPEKPDLLTAGDHTRLPSGLAGKMRVHKSGKVSLDWGDTAMEIRSGMEVDFLQDVVLLGDHVGPAGAGEEEKDGTGSVWALGQVRKKMVVTPDWGRIYD